MQTPCSRACPGVNLGRASRIHSHPHPPSPFNTHLFHAGGQITLLHACPPFPPATSLPALTPPPFLPPQSNTKTDQCYLSGDTGTNAGNNAFQFMRGAMFAEKKCTVFPTGTPPLERLEYPSEVIPKHWAVNLLRGRFVHCRGPESEAA